MGFPHKKVCPAKNLLKKIKKKVFLPAFKDYLKVDHEKTTRKQMVKA